MFVEWISELVLGQSLLQVCICRFRKRRMIGFHFSLYLAESKHPSQSSASSSHSSLTAAAHMTTSLLWTLMSELVVFHRCPIHVFMSHHPISWKRSYGQSFLVFCVFHSIRPKFQSKPLDQMCLHKVLPSDGTRVPAVLRILTNFQPLIAKLVIKNAILNEEASTFLLSKMPKNTAVETNKEINQATL